MWNYNFYLYITTNRDKSVLYVGVTSNLERRLAEHHENKGISRSFTAKYHCYYLVYHEHYTHIEAISREKEVKKWRRDKKNALVATINPEWRFLNNDIRNI